MASSAIALWVEAGRPKNSTNSPALAGVLVGQEREDAAVAEHLEHLVVAARLGDQLLARSLAERAEEPVEVGVVERPGHRVGREAEDAEQVAGHLPVAVVAGEHDDRPAAQEPVEDSARARPA